MCASGRTRRRQPLQAVLPEIEERPQLAHLHRVANTYRQYPAEHAAVLPGGAETGRRCGAVGQYAPRAIRPAQ